MKYTGTTTETPSPSGLVPLQAGEGWDGANGGMLMPGRSYSSDSYRFRFNGKENDNEGKGTGNQEDYGMRIYDPRIVKFLSVDPLTKDYPELTPYQFAGNNPIKFIDLDGLEQADPTWMAYDPCGAFLEGCRQWFDAAVNFFSVNVSQTFAANRPSSTTTGNTTTTNTTSIENRTEVSINGWDIFKPNAYTVGGNGFPAPNVKVTNETTVKKTVKTTTSVGPVSVTKKSVQQSNGNNSSSTTLKVGGTTNSGTPVSVSATNSNSNTTGTSTSGTVTVGSDNANIYFQISSTGANTTASGGANVSVSTPTVSGVNLSSETNVQVDVPIKK